MSTDMLTSYLTSFTSVTDSKRNKRSKSGSNEAVSSSSSNSKKNAVKASKTPLKKVKVGGKKSITVPSYLEKARKNAKLCHKKVDDVINTYSKSTPNARSRNSVKKLITILK